MVGFARQSGGSFLPDAPAAVAGWAIQHPVTVLSVNGAIPILSGVYRIINGTAGAYTLRAPTIAEEGTMLYLCNGTAAAHVITATGLLQNGVTGGAKNAATMAAFPGASVTLVALNLQWFVVASVVTAVA